MNIEDTIGSLEEFQTSIAINLFQKNNNFSDTYLEFLHLFKKESINKIMQNGLLHKNIKKALLKENLIFYAQIPQSNISTLKQKKDIKYENNYHSFNELQKFILTEENKEKRHTLYKLISNTIIQKLNPIYKTMYDHLNLISKDLGFNGYVNLCLEMLNVDLSSLKREIEIILQNTNNIYFNKLKKIVLTKGYLLKNIYSFDLPDIWSLKQYEKYFSKQLDIPYFLKELGLEQTLNKIEINLDNSNSYRSFCLPVKVPHEIKLFISTRERIDDQRIFFHELGHAVHISNIKENSHPQFRCWADESISEAFAFLFEGLFNNRDFIKKYYDLDDPIYHEILYLNRLYLLRLHTARILWEIDEIETNKNFQQRINSWSTYYRRIIGVNNEGLGAFIEREFFLKSINYLYGWMLEAQLRSYLEKEVGSQWFMDIHTGKLVRNILQGDNLSSAKDVSRIIGFKTLDSKELIKQLQENFL
ncbi:hypothetical protein [Bacillus pseudomycoides]|uniref:hypothetical protein n=1 Tax=Bacillus pseudomycoides TaxID=64104 RepID=UPI000BFD3936|nr:hypothetical protein [Bacillus pseudomycoides]MED1625120.1 hypothetical protein [Bacillus pseudomycoides]PHC41196.1 hypothetical protein COF01_04860 [Bacillus pseudomycoides]